MVFPVKNVNLFGRIRPVLLDQLPFHVYISQNFYGMFVDYTRWGLKSHGGLDTPTAYREPCLGLGWGMVRYSHRQRSTEGVDYGNVITVWYPDMKLEVLYRHMDENVVKDGYQVQEGQVLGYCGSTGISTANHLHWEFKRTDDQGNVIDKSNGWKGGVDPELFYKNMTITKDELELLYLAVFGRLLDADALGYVGKPLDFVLKHFMQSPEYKANAAIQGVLKDKFKVIT